VIQFIPPRRIPLPSGSTLCCPIRSSMTDCPSRRTSRFFLSLCYKIFLSPIAVSRLEKSLIISASFAPPCPGIAECDDGCGDIGSVLLVSDSFFNFCLPCPASSAAADEAGCPGSRSHVSHFLRSCFPQRLAPEILDSMSSYEIRNVSVFSQFPL